MIPAYVADRVKQTADRESKKMINAIKEQKEQVEGAKSYGNMLSEVTQKMHEEAAVIFKEAMVKKIQTSANTPRIHQDTGELITDLHE